MNELDFKLSSYQYDLPPDLIAQHPAERGTDRLLVVDRETGKSEDAYFADLASWLPKDALLVANNSRVIPARLFGKRHGGGAAEFLLLTPLPFLNVTAGEAEVEGLLKPSKRLHSGDVLTMDGDLFLTVLEKKDFGRHRVRLTWQGNLQTILERFGHLPLPPYIHREDTEGDRSSYQTCYARDDKTGSVAAPTAGLHFTPEIRQKLLNAGLHWDEVTLHVGYGTFSPVRCEDIRNHVMHEEFVEISEETANNIRQAKKDGRPVIAVGTTSVRTLEAVAASRGEIVSYFGNVNCFIYPGYEFRIIDGLITNFHLPESTLLMLVSALTGREKMLDIYRSAVKRKYHFFSYGDAMLIC